MCLSAAFIYYVLKRILPLPKAAVILNTIGFYIVFYAVSVLLTSLTGNPLFSLLAKSGASLGMGAMFLAAAYACGKQNEL